MTGSTHLLVNLHTRHVTASTHLLVNLHTRHVTAIHTHQAAAFFII